MKLTEIIYGKGIYLREALDLATAKKYTSMERNPAIQRGIDNIFQKLSNMEGAIKSKRGDRIYIPFEDEGNSLDKSSEGIERDITDALQDAGYLGIKDYVKGIAIDEYEREVKIGKALNKIDRQDLLRKFNTDPAREGKATDADEYLAFSKHPYDIAGSATDRGWTSCLDLYTGTNKEYVKHDVQEGTIICYLVEKDDMNIENPKARVLIKPYVNISDSRNVLYSTEESVYGTAPAGFQKQVKEIIDDVQDSHIGAFKLKNSIYCDTGDRHIQKFSKGAQEVLDGKRPPATRREVIEMIDYLEFAEMGDVKISVNNDLTVSIIGDVNMSWLEKDLKKIPIEFETVHGDFSVAGNSLRTLENSPREVRGNYNIQYNSLESLEGSPERVGGHFFAQKLEFLFSLDGISQYIGGNLYLSEDNKLISPWETIKYIELGGEVKYI